MVDRRVTVVAERQIRECDRGIGHGGTLLARVVGGAWYVMLLHLSTKPIAARLLLPLRMWDVSGNEGERPMKERLEADVLVIGAGMAGAGAAAHVASTIASCMSRWRTGPAITRRDARRRSSSRTMAGRRSGLSARQRGDVRERRQGAVPDAAAVSPRGMLNVCGEDGIAHHDELLSMSEGLRQITADEAVGWCRSCAARRSQPPPTRRTRATSTSPRCTRAFSSRRGRPAARSISGARCCAASEGRPLDRETASHEIAAPVVVTRRAPGRPGREILRPGAPSACSPCAAPWAVLPAPEGYDSRRWPLIGDAAETWYAKPDGGAPLRLALGGNPGRSARRLRRRHDPCRGLHRFEQAVTIPVTHVERSWAGLRTFAPDRTPVAGFDRTAEGFFWLAGQGGLRNSDRARLVLAGATVDKAGLPAGRHGSAGSGPVAEPVPVARLFRNGAGRQARAAKEGQT